MFDSPEPLPDGAVIDHFTPDATLSWLVAYAGPCGDPGCNLDHRRLYMIPMVGWLHAVTTDDEIKLRPAIMSTSGVVVDYLRLQGGFVFIAVVRATDDAVRVAREAYSARFEGEQLIIEGEVGAASSN